MAKEKKFGKEEMRKNPKVYEGEFLEMFFSNLSNNLNDSKNEIMREGIMISSVEILAEQLFFYGDGEYPDRPNEDYISLYNNYRQDIINPDLSIEDIYGKYYQNDLMKEEYRNQIIEMLTVARRVRSSEE